MRGVKETSVEFHIFRIIERPSVQAVLVEEEEEDDTGDNIEIADCRKTSGHVTSKVHRGRAVFFTRFLPSSKEMF